jgi:diguanylate cyclase (GGDEF)-like protein
MTITKKTLLVIVTMFAVVIASLFLYFRFFVLNDYVKLEEQHVTNSIEQSKKILDNKINSMLTTSWDWSAWDDTYYFISDGNLDYIDSNLIGETYVNLDLNSFTLIDNNKNIKYIGLFDLKNNIPVEVSDDFKTALLNEEKLVHHISEESEVTGIALLNDIPALVVSVPILKNNNSGPINGALIMARYIDNSISDFISSSVGYPINLYNIYASDTKKYETILENLTTSKDPNKNIEIQYLSNNQLSGYSIIKDIYGNPILLLQILLPREIYQEGVKHINEFYIFTLVIAFLSCLSIFILLRKIILSRITNLNIQTINIGKNRNFAKNIAVRGNDEISKLTNGINSMLVEIRKHENEIKHLSFHDYLTGIYNRAFFEEELHRLDTERQLPLTIVIGDVNGLKIINDAFGHEKGDELLIKIAKILKESFRSEDIVARWGGDEFTVILPKINLKDTLKIMSRINKKLKKESTKTLPLSIAFGLSTKEDSFQKIDELIKTAEDKMYRHKMIEQQSAHSAIISSLGKALEERDYETSEHVKRMKNLAIELGTIINLSEEALDELTLLAALHDIGKISIADSIILKPRSLTSEEWKIIKKHPEVGYRIAESSAELAPIAKGILYHHEWWDGKGYPKGLTGEKIPLISRIISIVDAYDAMTNDRPYRKALSIKEAISEIRRCAGSQFDPNLAAKFVGIIEKATNNTLIK